MTAKEEFKHIVKTRIGRVGISDLMDWLEAGDFYTAPASTRFHGSCEGGLLKHSLAVYMRLVELTKVYGYGYGYKSEIQADETIAIVSLFHDICKVNYYTTEMRWRKNSLDKWEQYPVYKVDEKFPFGGHGSKSVYLIQHFMNLTPEEASAINCHMGAWDKSDYSNPSAVFESNHLAWMLHVADEAATYIDHS